MKKIVFLSLFVLLGLSSCNDDNNPIVEESFYNFEYLKGEIGGRTYILRNTEEEKPINMVAWSRYRTNIEAIHWPVNFPGNEPMRLFVFLRSPHRGVYLLTQDGTFAQDDDFSSGIDLLVQLGHGEQAKMIKYVPNPQNPFVIVVQDMWYTQKEEMPFLKGYMYGTLYNRENPQDSIVFKDVEFGMH